MADAEFDRYAADYRKLHADNIALTGEEPEYFADYKMRDFAALVRQRGLSAQGSYLDFGCGTGASVVPFKRHLPQAMLVGADVSQESLRHARDQHGVMAEFRSIDSGALSLPSAQFDGAFANCVFHHIPAEDHAQALSELHRVCRDGGMLMIYEHNPLNPLTVRAVNTCPLDENAVLIRAGTMVKRVRAAGWADVRVAYRVFFPAALKRFRPTESALRWLPLGAQYCLTARRT
ncbi:MAG: class I SAM-dependent methyltransferase [Rhodoferax sp.]|nr:class I SAM-dependent methyltransferase [Rhodoferax sp.]